MPKTPRTTLSALARLASIAAAAAVLITLPASAQNAVTGNWNGSYVYSIQVSGCSNKTFNATGNVSLTILQTGNSLSGRIDLANDVAIDNNCNATTIEVTRTIVGTVSDGTLSFIAPASPALPQFQGTISGNTLNAEWTDANGGGGTLTATRATGDAPAVNTTGTWSGNYTFTDKCSNGATIKYTGPLILGLTQSGATAGGVATLQNVPLYDQTCRNLATLTQAMVATGTISGSTFTGGVYDPSGSFEFPITATISNGSLSGTVSGANDTNTTGTFTLTQSTTAQPAADFGGSWEGNYSETDNESFNCLNIGALTFSGPASMTIVQADGGIAGWVAFHNAQTIATDGLGGCAIVPSGDEVLPIYGTLSGGAVKVTIPLGNNAVALLTVTFNGTSASGTLQDSFGDSASFTATRTAAATQVSVGSFTAVPTTAVAGTPVTLSWTTANATAVSIDNGVGSQPLSGSVNVFPQQTTIYTLTATGPGGPQTATAKVTIVPLAPKRRAAKP